MKFGLLTAILEGTTFEEAVDFAAENQLECLEVACWPKAGLCGGSCGTMRRLSLQSLL